jgi:hypothetical protein
VNPIGPLQAVLQLLLATLSVCDFVENRARNPMGETWTLLAEASFRRSSDLLGATHALEAAREAADRYGSPLAYAGGALALGAGRA